MKDVTFPVPEDKNMLVDRTVALRQCVEAKDASWEMEEKAKQLFVGLVSKGTGLV